MRIYPFGDCLRGTMGNMLAAEQVAANDVLKRLTKLKYWVASNASSCIK
jgi:cytoplasmic iron level regulating protein YaaA (DUF328/UPF0246 family)